MHVNRSGGSLPHGDNNVNGVQPRSRAELISVTSIRLPSDQSVPF